MVLTVDPNDETDGDNGLAFASPGGPRRRGVGCRVIANDKISSLELVIPAYAQVTLTASASATPTQSDASAAGKIVVPVVALVLLAVAALIFG